jgi:hypothetical protein
LSYSAVVGAPPYSHYWFILLERMRVGSTASMVLDQVVWRPLTIAWSFIVGAVLADGSLVVRPAPHSRQPSAAGLLRWLTGASCVLPPLLPPPAESSSEPEEGLQEGGAERPGPLGASSVHQLSLRPNAVARAVHRRRPLLLVRSRLPPLRRPCAALSRSRRALSKPRTVRTCRDIYMCVLTMESKSASDKKVEDEAAQKLKQ